MELVINSVGKLLYDHRYIFSFLGALFEGNYIMILKGVLFKFGYFKFWGVLVVLVLGYFLNGIALYLIGWFGGQKILKKWGNRFHLTRTVLKKLENYFQKHSAKTLFITRITYGLSIPSLIMAGSFKMNSKKFLIVSLAGAIIWAGMLFGLGYVFGVSYKALGVVTKTISIGLVIVFFIILILISILIVYWFRRFAKTKFMRKITEENPFRFLEKIGKIVNNLVNNKK